ncbi:MAG: hypothetical protein PHG44_03570 [Lentisphaeria bacterium]|nr:hypothetical protein [Lentisphaeria bacterium]
MSDRLKRLAAVKLADNLANLNASELELVGHMLVSAIEGRILVHRGLNAQAKPVGYTVDTFDGNRTVVAEYSTEADYFSPPFDKIQKDTRHACDQAADLQHLYLVSNSACQNSNWEGVVQAVKSIWAKPEGKVNILDSRLLAESIYKQVVEKTVLYEGFADFLPSLEAVWRDHNFAYNRPQPPSDYVQDSDRESMLLGAIANYPIVVVHGISGIGKSYLLRSALAGLDGFDNVVWLSGDDIPGSSGSFSSVTVGRLGMSFNLAGQFNNTRTLLVVDGWEETIDAGRLGELRVGFERGSRIVISSQLAPSLSVNAFPITTTKADCAKRILTIGIGDLTSGDLHAVDAIVKGAGGHPLLMAIIRGLVANGDATMQEIANDSANWPSYEDLETQSRILDRLFQNHATSVGEELSAARWLGTKVLDGELAASVFGRSGVAKLRRRSLVTDDSFGLLRFHDTAFLCIARWAGETDENGLVERFLGFFRQRLDIADYHFQRALHTCAGRVVGITVNGPPTPGLPYYLYLLLDLPAKDNSIVERLAKANLADHVDSLTAIECIVEARETWRHLRVAVADQNEFDRETVVQVDELKARDLPSLTKHILLHHQGKAYRRLRREADARVALRDALALHPSALHTRLQLARVTSGNEQVDHLRAILEQFMSDENAVAITVVLAAIEIVGKLNNMATVMPMADLLRLSLDAIAMAQCEGYGQPFITLASISRALWYNDPDTLVNIAGTLVLPPSAALDPLTARGVADTMKNIAKALLNKGNLEVAQQWLLLAEPYYGRVDTTKVFDATMVAEYWVLRRDGREGLKVLVGFPEKDRSAFFYHRRAQANALTGNTDVALADIERALNMTEPKYRSAYLACKAEICIQAKLVDQARECLLEAFSCCDSDKFKADIQKKIDSLC